MQLFTALHVASATREAMHFETEASNQNQIPISHDFPFLKLPRVYASQEPHN